MPKGNKQRERRPTSDELKSIYKIAGEMSPELAVIIELAVETAMRRSELVELRKDQIREGRIFGGHQERRAPICSVVVQGTGLAGGHPDANRR